MWDIFDELFGRLNPIDRILGQLKRAVRPSKSGQFGPTVQIRVPRTDKNKDAPSLNEVTAHLEAYGVTSLCANHRKNGPGGSTTSERERYVGRPGRGPGADEPTPGNPWFWPGLLLCGLVILLSLAA